MNLSSGAVKDVIATPAVSGQATMANSSPVVIASDQSAIAVTGTFTPSGTQTVAISQTGTNNDVDATITNATLAVTQSGTWNVTNVSGTVSLPTGAATSALQTQPGVDIGDVTINNAAGVSAVNIQDGGNAITVDGAVSVTGSVTANAGTNLNTSLLALEGGGNLAAMAASLSVLDDWDETNRAAVNLISGQAGIAAGTGVDGVTVPRVTLATNVALPAGTNAIGKLAANSGVTIGAVELAAAQTLSTVTTVTSLTQMNGVAISMGTGVRDTGTQRVTIATNDAVPVTDNSGSLTVDYATTGSGTAIGALRVELPTNGTGVIATVGAVTAITNALPAGTNGIGKLTANSGVDIGDVDITSIAAGDNNIGNVDIVTMPAVTQSGTWTVQPGNTANTTPWLVKEQRPPTGTRTQVADIASDTQILASNTARLGATVYNDSSALLYLGLGTTAVTSSNYTVKLFSNGYYEVPTGFTNELRGLWATDPGDGGAKITELT